jgi:hypothetical protein
MAGKRGVQVLGLGAVGIGGYYLYNAGGSPKVAEKQLERKLPCCALRDPLLILDRRCCKALQPGPRQAPGC